MALQLADSNILPFDFRDTSKTLQSYLNSIKQLVKGSSNPGLQSSLCDPIQKAIDDFTAVSQTVQARVILCTLIAHFFLKVNSNDQKVNVLLYNAERRFLYENGLPDRPYFRNMLQAPGLYSGYGADSFPGL